MGRELYNGSFPSGHATMMVPLLLLVPLFQIKKYNFISYSLSFLVLASAVVMGLSRVVSGDHWVADCVASIVLGFWFLNGFIKSI